jgi:hypothetical protein
VVWEDQRNGEYDIYGYDLESQTEFAVCTDAGETYMMPAISGNIVVWSHMRPGETYDLDDIYGYDLQAGTGFSISRPTAQFEPAVSGNILVWAEYHPYEMGIYGFSLAANDECQLAAEVSKGVAYNGTTTGMTGMDVSSCAYNDPVDVWHSFTPTVAGDYTVSLCGSDFDTTLTIFDDCGGVEMACNDDYCDVQSQVDLKAKADVEYLIRVAGYDGDTGDYTLTISGPAECLNRPSSDVNGDCKVDFKDFAVMCSEWLDCGLDMQEACWE